MLQAFFSDSEAVWHILMILAADLEHKSLSKACKA